MLNFNNLIVLFYYRRKGIGNFPFLFVKNQIKNPKLKNQKGLKLPKGIENVYKSYFNPRT